MYLGANFGIKIGSLGQWVNLLRHPGEVNNLKQMASNKPILSTMVVVEFKIKKEKDKKVNVEELMTLGQTMVSNELQDEEAQILKKLGGQSHKSPSPKK